MRLHVKPLLFLLFIFICKAGYSQPVGAQRQADATTNTQKQADASINTQELPDDYAALNQRVAENEQTYKELHDKLISRQFYAKNLAKYKKSVDAVDASKIDALIKSISDKVPTDNNQAISPATNEDIYNLEVDILSMIQPLCYGDFDLSFNFRISADNDIVSDDFYSKISDISKAIKSGEVIKIMRNHNKNVNTPTLNTKIDITNIQGILNSTKINTLKTQLTNAIQKEIEANETNIQSINTDVTKNRDEHNKIISKQSQGTQINSLAIKLGLPLFCSTILLLFLVPYFFSRNDTNPDNSDRSQSTIVEISTVLLLTMSILILGLANRINSDVLGTLIGGISGYVLNRARARANSDS